MTFFKWALKWFCVMIMMITSLSCSTASDSFAQDNLSDINDVGTQVASQSNGGARIIYQSNNNDVFDQVTIDVLWCSGDDKSSRRELVASQIAASYGTLAKFSASHLDQFN